MLKMATAIQRGTQPEAVGKQLAIEALKKLEGAKPAFALLFATSRLNLEQVVKAVRNELKQVPLIGCTTAGEFTEQAVQKESASLALLSESEDYAFHVSMATGLHDDPAGCVQKAVDQIPAPADGLPHRSAIFLHDGLAGRGEEAVLSATTILGADVHFAGGAAADDLDFKKTFVACNDLITGDSIALCVIDSKHPVAIGVKHGHTPVTQVLTVTKAKENVLQEVDGKPAWEVWTGLLAEEAGKNGIDVAKLDSPSDIGQFLLRYELGLATGSEFKVRIPLSKNPDGSLNFACTIPEGAKFRIMKSPKEDQIVSAKQSAQNAKDQLGREAVAGALVFDCACRGLILGDEFYQGIDAIKDVIGPIPMMGFETYGEICRQPGQLSGLHNTTTVVMLLPA